MPRSMTPSPRAWLPAVAVLAVLLAAAPARALGGPLNAPDAAPDAAPLPAPRLAATLALADAGEGGTAVEDGPLRMHAGPEDADDWHAPWFTGNKLHQYLGIGSLVAAGLAAVSAPDGDEGGTGGEGEDDGFHHVAGVTAAALGGAAVGTGLVFHWDDIRLKNGIGDPDNLHALLGLLGATAYVVAVSQAPAGGHAAAGIGGAVAMITAIKITW